MLLEFWQALVIIGVCLLWGHYRFKAGQREINEKAISIMVEEVNIAKTAAKTSIFTFAKALKNNNIIDFDEKGNILGKDGNKIRPEDLYK